MLRRISTLAFGAGFSQLILFGAIPILTRLYRPEDFGSLAIVVAAATIISTVASGRYEAAIPLATDPDDSPGLILLCFALVLSVSAILLLAAISIEFLSVPASFVGYSIYGWQISLLVLCLALTNILTFWCIRHGRYKLIASGRLVHATATVAMQLVLVNYVGGLGLIYGAIFGYLLQAAILLASFIRNDRALVFNLASVLQVRAAANRHLDFPKFASWSVLLNSLSNHVTSFLFFRFLSPAIAGHYAMATRLVKAPLTIVGQSIYQVVAQESGSNVANKKRVVTDAVGVLTKMAHTAFIPFLVLAITIENLVPLVLGDDWQVAGRFARLMLPWLFALYLSWPMTALYNTLSHQRQLLGFNALFLIAVVVPFLLVPHSGGATNIVACIAFLSGLARLGYIFWLFVKHRSNSNIGIPMIILPYFFIVLALSFWSLLENGT